MWSRRCPGAGWGSPGRLPSGFLCSFSQSGEVRCLVLFSPLCFPKSCWNFEQAAAWDSGEPGVHPGDGEHSARCAGPWQEEERQLVTGHLHSGASRVLARVLGALFSLPLNRQRSHHLRPCKAEACSHWLGVYYSAWHTGVQSKSLSLGLSRLSCAIFPGRPALSSTHFTEEKTEP